MSVLAKERRHVVYLSAMSVRDDRPTAENGLWGQVEEAVRWSELPPEVARDQLAAAWGNAELAAGALAYWASLVDTPEPVTDTVRQVTGAPARTFREWAVDHAADFR